MGLPDPAALGGSGVGGLDLGWIRRMWPVLRPHRRSVAVALSLGLAALLLQVAVPALVGRTISDAVATTSSPLTPYLVALTAVAIARGILSVLYRYGLYRMAFEVEADLRTTLYRHYTTLSHSFFDRMQSGQLISRAQADVRAVQIYFAVAPLIATSVLSFVLAFGVMLAVDATLALVAVAPLPFVYAVGVVMRNRLFPLSWIVQGRQAEVATVTEESIAGVRVVQSFAAEQARVDEMARAARRLRWANVQQGLTRARWSPLLEGLPRLGSLAVLVYGGWLVIEGDLAIGAIITFNSYIVLLQVPFRFLGFFLILGQRARASAERIFEVLDEVPEIADPDEPVPLGVPRGRVELRDVHFGYGSGPEVLSGVDLRIDPGETVALVGGTGSGKSTVARLVGRSYDPRRGQVLLDGIDVRRIALSELHRAVVVAPDEPFLFSTTIADNLAFAAPGADRADLEAVAATVDAHGFIEGLDGGYGAVVGERGYTLSGGQRQRIALGRALLVDPAVLVLDDAMSAVDVEVEARIHSALGEHRAGRTTILIAHRLSTIALADRVVFLDGGRVAATGAHVDLLRDVPAYAAVLDQLTRVEVIGPAGAGEPAVPATAGPPSPGGGAAREPRR
jgi:ATP-binding cassette subfamily B protein